MDIIGTIMQAALLVDQIKGFIYSETHLWMVQQPKL